MTTGNRIKRRRLELGFTVDELARKIGKNRATIYRYENNDIENYSTLLLEPLAHALETSPAYLMGWEDAPTAQPWECYPGTIPPPDMVMKPLLGTIACGTPITAIENADEYVPVPADVKCDFALRCQGDSMINARILDGDIVYIKAQPQVENGEIAAVLIDGEATLKRFKKIGNVIMLFPENAAYEPIIVDEKSDVKIIGKAVAYLSLIK